MSNERIYPGQISNSKKDNFAKDQADEISLKEVLLKLAEWWHYLVSKWIVILIVGIIGGVSGLIYSIYRKPAYVAELTFALEEEQSAGGLGSALGLASQFGFDLGGNSSGIFTGDNLLELMKSRSMVEKTLLSTIEIGNKKQTLAELYIDYNKLRAGWNERNGLNDVSFEPNTDRSKFTLKQDSLLGIFHQQIIKKNLIVNKIDKKLSIISVRLITESETFSKYFTELLVKNVADFYVQTTTKKATQNLRLLQHQTDSVRRELNDAIGGVAATTDINPNPNPSRMVLRVPSQRRQVDVQANTAILTELVKNLELAKISLRRETPLIQVIDKPVLPLEKQRTGKFKGVILGGVLAGFLISLILLLKKIISDVLM